MNQADRTGPCVRPGLEGRACTPRNPRRNGPSNGPARPPDPTSESHPTPAVSPPVERAHLDPMNCSNCLSCRRSQLVYSIQRHMRPPS